MHVRPEPQPAGPYARRGLAEVAPDPETEGPYGGIEYANVHPWIGSVCSMPEGGVNVERLVRFKRGDLTLDDLLDALEIDVVGRSWRAAAKANLRLRHGD